VLVQSLRHFFSGRQFFSHSPESSEPRKRQARRSSALPAQNYSNYLKAYRNSSCVQRFSNETLRRYASQFAAAGHRSGDGIGRGERSQAGQSRSRLDSAFSAVLFVATWILRPCTVT